MIERIARRILPQRVRFWMQGKRVLTIREGRGAGLKIDTRRASGDYESGLNEIPVQEALARHLKHGDVFYDVGANTGFFTLIGARLVGERGAVFAFEPVAQNTAVVRHNIELNKFQHVVVIEKAVASKSGQGELVLTRHPGGATLVTNHLPPDATGTTAIELVSLDDVAFLDTFKPPTLVKIDVEGAELDVLRGMERLLRTVKPVILYELDDEGEAELARKSAECESHLRARGYTVTQLPNAYPGMKWLVEHYLAIPL